MSPAPLLPAEPIPGRHLDPGALTAMFAANRIARELDVIASFAHSERFVLSGDVLSDVMGLLGAQLRDWILSIDECARPSDLAPSAAALKDEAIALFTDVRGYRRSALPSLARRARRWADAVQGWASITGSLPL